MVSNGGSRPTRRRSVVGRWWLIRHGLLACFSLGCGRADDGRHEVRGDVPWLESCAEDTDCAEGQCLCGVCSVPCRDGACEGDGPPGARCLEPEHWLGAALCAGREAAPMCVTGCAADGSCEAGAECLDGYCVGSAVAGIARDAELIPVGPLCERDRVVWRSVHLQLPEQVEALRGCERIEGHLQIDADGVSDFSALASLREVVGSIDILARRPRDERAAPRVDLAGLERLESAARLRLVNVIIDTLAPLGALRAIEGRDDSGLRLESVQGLTSLEGLGRLERMRLITVSNSSELVSLRGLSSLRELAALDVGGAPLDELGLPAELVINGSLSLRQTRLVTLAGLGQASRFVRAAISNNAALVSLDGLKVVEHAEELTFEDNPKLEDVRALAGLREVDGQLLLSGCPLRSLAGLEDLERVYYLGVSGSNIVDLGGLGRLQAANGGLAFFSNPALASLAGLPPGASIGELSLGNNPSLTRLDVGSVSIDGLRVTESPLADMSGLEAVTLGSRLDLQGLPNLVSLAGLRAPAAGLGFVHLQGCPALVDIGALAGLRAIDTLVVAECGLANLDVFAGLERLSDVTLSANPNLAQIDGIASSAGLGQLSVSQNPSLVALPSFDAVVDVLDPSLCGDACGLSLTLSGNALLERGPTFPNLAQVSAVSAVANPNLVSLGSFPAVRALAQVHVEGNPGLVALGLPNLERAASLVIRGNGLPESELTALRALPNVSDRRIVSNGAGPDRLDPCPWALDGVCDEVFESCGAGTDSPDCLDQDVPAWGTTGTLP